MVGNVRELTKLWRTGNPLHNPGSPPGTTMILSAVGGSVKKGFVKTFDPRMPVPPATEIHPSNVMAGDWNSNISEAGDPDVGFRPIRIQY